MCVRYLGFVLLVWFPVVLHTQSAAQPCRAPRLNGGYLVPEQDTYSNETTLTYGCDDGLKPAVEGWWATITCQNGSWSHEPECIDEKDCLPPDIPNAKYTASQNGWFKDGHKVRITCDAGYEPKDRQVTTICINGTWSSVLVCKKRSDSCGEPPKVPHAVIIHRRHQAVYPADTELQYECKDGYTVEGADTTKTITCFFGKWTEGPTCSSKPDTGHGGSTVGGAGGGHTTSASSGTQPAGGNRETRPTPGQGGGTHGRGTQPEGGSTHGSGTQPEGGSTHGSGTQPEGGSTHGSGTQPEGGRSSTTSGSTDRDSAPTFRPVEDCGASPIVPNADVVQKHRISLKYQCDAFHTLVGEATVACYSDRTWSPLPFCKEAYCALDPALYARYSIQVSGATYLKEGEQKHFPCSLPDYSRFQCTNGIITFTRCCSDHDHYWGHCR